MSRGQGSYLRCGQGSKLGGAQPFAQLGACQCRNLGRTDGRQLGRRQALVNLCSRQRAQLSRGQCSYVSSFHLGHLRGRQTICNLRSGQCRKLRFRQAYDLGCRQGCDLRVGQRLHRQGAQGGHILSLHRGQLGSAQTLSNLRGRQNSSLSGRQRHQLIGGQAEPDLCGRQAQYLVARQGRNLRGAEALSNLLRCQRTNLHRCERR